MSFEGRRDRYLDLDVLRALAVILVMFEHYSGIPEYFPIGAGDIGVGLFFVLSGYLITSILISDLDKEQKAALVLKGFYVRRFFRLFPIYYILLTILIFLELGNVKQDWAWHFSYLSNVNMALGGETNVFWTLAVEEQFYLVWPIILVLIPVGYRLHSAVFLIIFTLFFKLVCLYLGVFPDFRLLPSQFTRLGAGALLAIWVYRDGCAFKTNCISPAQMAFLQAAAVTGLIGASTIWYFDEDPYLRLLFNDFLCVPAFVYIIICATNGIRSKYLRLLFDNEFLIYLGSISYGIYLVHNWVPKYIDTYIGLTDFPKLVLTLFLTIGICAFSWKYIEYRCIQFGRRISYST
ncbi:MAG: acyltransferase [Pseudoruegeria sp.]